MKWIGIGIFSASGRTSVLYCVDGKPVKFGSLQSAETYIRKHGLGEHASPIEIYED